jgi:S-DNA-T family DNA segregation ATPase FtsK/SpoIIIE
VARHRQAVSELRAEEAQWAEMKDAEEEQAAEALAAQAILETQGDEDLAPARAAAEALAREQIRRSEPPAPVASFGLLASEPAWAAELAASAVTEPPEPLPREKTESVAMAKAVSTVEKPRRRRKAVSDQPEALTDPGMEAVVVPAPEIVLPPVVEKAFVVPPVPTTPPEIILSQAMLDRPRKKKEKENPSFAFTQSGEVFKLPATALLQAREEIRQDVDEGGLQRTAATIVATLKEHAVEGSIRSIRPGPVVTLFEFLPVAGVKLARIENLDKELTMALSAVRIRIIAPIPGKGVVGIEVPNGNRATVYLRDVFESETFATAGGLLPLALGKNIEGLPYCVDLQKMPHLLIAGTTGSGKSVGLNTMILSMLYRQTPDQVRMIMVDPKMTELSIYEDIPHLLLPVVTDPAKAARALQWAVDEMERRTQILADTGVRDLKSYNAKVEKLRLEGRTLDQDIPLPNKKLLVVDVSAGETEEEAQARMAREEAEAEANGAALAPLPTSPYEDPTAPPPVKPENNPAGLEFGPPDRPAQPQKLPYIVVIIDELADLMMTAPREVELSLARLAQKARATGIHLMVATQRPSTDIVTGAIKNNFPARISFRLASRHDSTTIINGPGAESLLGDGDMLIMTATAPVTRVQGAFVAEEEIHRVVAFLKEQGRPVYDEAILKARDGNGTGPGSDGDEEDPVYDQALELVCRMDEVSVSKLQREMRLGYNKAAKIVERMEREGIVGPANGVKPRQVLLRPAGEANPMPNV